MSTTLLLSAFVLGLAGGPHCAAMCGAACGGVVRMAMPGDGSPPQVPALVFHAGRLAGYAGAGAAASAATASLAWLAGLTSALRPVWLLFHLAVLAWGLVLVARARQPALVERFGRDVWVRVQPLASRRRGLFGAGLAWTFMPCGLLYSALLLASLTDTPAGGALAMALFALGSGAWLLAAPWLVHGLRGAGNRLRRTWGTRASGLLLVSASLFSLDADLAHRVAAWCGVA